MYNLPNILTISRIVVIPVIFLSIYIPWTSWSILTALLYAVAAITDYFDGYLARSRNQVSIFGRLLDPIADKLLVVAALLIIVAKKDMIHPISYIPVMIILCREVLVSGLREFLANMKVDMPVTKLAKWKTTVQMVSIGCILFSAIPVFSWVAGLGELLLWVAGGLTFVTGYAYFQKSLNYVKSTHAEKQTEEKIVAKKTPVKKAVVKKISVKKAVVKKAVVKKAVTKKAVVKKAVTKKAPAKKVKS